MAMNKVFFWILIGIAAIYILGFFACFILMINFYHKLKKRLLALSLLCDERKEILLSLKMYFEETKVDFEQIKIECYINSLNYNKKRINENDLLSYRISLDNIENFLNYVAEENTYVKAGSDYLMMKSLLDDLNTNYRRIVTRYNADVLGYNYWFTRFLYHYLFFIFGFRRKKSIY